MAGFFRNTFLFFHFHFCWSCRYNWPIAISSIHLRLFYYGQSTATYSSQSVAHHHLHYQYIVHLFIHFSVSNLSQPPLAAFFSWFFGLIPFHRLFYSWFILTLFGMDCSYLPRNKNAKNKKRRKQQQEPSDSPHSSTLFLFSGIISSQRHHPQ